MTNTELLPFYRRDMSIQALWRCVERQNRYADLVRELDLSTAAQVILTQLVRLTVGFDRKCHRVSQIALAARCNCSRMTVVRGIEELQAKGVIVTERRMNRQDARGGRLVNLIEMTDTWWELRHK